MKYQPYWGYGIHHGRPYYYPRAWPIRVRTRNGWRFNYEKPEKDTWHLHPRYGRGEARYTYCTRCNKNHCVYCGCNEPWRRYDDAGGHGSVYEKRDVHRRFRRTAKRLIARELSGDDAISHAFRICGDWLD